MWIPKDNWLPSSSFVEPVAIPEAAPFDEPQLGICFNASWLPYIIGSLMQLIQPTTWATADPTALQNVLDNVQELLSAFGSAGDCVALSFRFTDACVLQYSTDGGDTWNETPGWSDFAPDCFTGPTGETGEQGPQGETGPTGETGANGITPQLRWSGCSFQVSTDSGSTWTNLSGFDIATLQGCLGGTPTIPTGVSVPQNACNVANWLAVNILQSSMSSLATSLGAGASTITTGLALFGLAASWTGIGTIVFGAIDGFITVGSVIGQTALSTAASDTTLRSNLICAIYSAIATDGYVTSSNFGTVLTNINAISYGTPGIVGLIHDYVATLGYPGIAAIQAEGTLYVGDCSACTSWCYVWNNSGGAAMNTYWSALSSVGTYSGGVWHSASGGGVQGIRLQLTLDPLRTYTHVEFTLSNGVTSAGSMIRIWVGPGTTGTLVVNNGTNSWTGSVNGDRYLLLAYDDLSNVPFTLTQIKMRGTGANPFGPDNCV